VGDSGSFCFSVLAWQDNAGGRDGGIGGRMFPDGAVAREAEAQNDSRSGSDHLDAISGVGEDEDDAEPSNPRKRKKRYHRHTPQQIQELEAQIE
jgi:homeobox-leucine zipper protein